MGDPLYPSPTVLDQSLKANISSSVLNNIACIYLFPVQVFCYKELSFKIGIMPEQNNSLTLHFSL